MAHNISQIYEMYTVTPRLVSRGVHCMTKIMTPVHAVTVRFMIMLSALRVSPVRYHPPRHASHAVAVRFMIMFVSATPLVLTDQ